jgi:hypothetical protein
MPGPRQAKHLKLEGLGQGEDVPQEAQLFGNENRLFGSEQSLQLVDLTMQAPYFSAIFLPALRLSKLRMALRTSE